MSTERLSPQEILEALFRRFKDAGVRSPNDAREYYEIAREPFEGTIAWCLNNAQRMGASPQAEQFVAGQLFFVLLCGAELHKGGVIP